MINSKKFTLVETYDMLTVLLGEVRRGVVPPSTAFSKIQKLVDNVNSTIPGIILKTPTLTDLYMLVPSPVEEESSYESSEEYESSYESSEC